MTRAARFTTVIPAYGPDGNIFAIGGTAMRLMREIGLPREEIADFRRRLAESQSYDAACAIVGEYFPLDRDDD